MTLPKNKLTLLKYTYDFAVSGGAVSSITLTSNFGSIVEGMIIKRAYILVDTALASAGSPTLTIGNTGDKDGYFADIVALAGAANAVINSGSVAGALLWDDTNDHEIYYRVDSTANNQDLVVTIGTAALTAGKLDIYLECVIPD